LLRLERTARDETIMADVYVGLLGDPSVGREQWSLRDLEVLWHGTGLRLVRR
jgi:hypothetical protein